MSTFTKSFYGNITLLCLLTFLLLSYIHITTKVASTKSVFNNINTTNIQTQPASHHPQIISNSTCIPPKITGIPTNDPIRKLFLKNLFNIKCKPHEKLTTRKWTNRHIYLKVRQKWVDRICFKYNNKYNNELFCDGGELIYLDRPWYSAVCDINEKPSLNRVLKTYCNKYHSNDNVCDFNILTYNLDNTKERNKFLSNHIDCNNNKPQYNKTWVFKENAHQGKGIHIFNNHEIIYRLITANISENIENCTFDPIQNETFFIQEGFHKYHEINNNNKIGYIINRKDCVIQQFISNPLLVKLHKNDSIKHVFHLRSYFMIASYSNPFIVLHFPKPILLINPNKYENKQEILDKNVLLTNRHITGYPDTKSLVHNVTLREWYEDLLWGYKRFQNYLDETYGNLTRNYTVNLNSEIKHIIKHIFNANSYNNKLKNRKIFDINHNYHFDMLCMDLMITNKFELKLLEVNANCGHFCKEPDKDNIAYDWDCDNRYNEARNIAMEIFKKKYYNLKVEKIDTLNHYEIAFWE